MKSTPLLALAALLSLGAVGNALADDTVLVAVAKPVAPVMTHEIATLIQLTHQAQAQYRRSGSPQDMARVRAMHLELASRGFGKQTQTAPAVLPAQETVTTVASTAP
ncbi:MAG: hypothetical protein IPN53_24760 [Comamonadaceae bacterium]|nr:hypothetical protein [Comamonadaceae bacterium]